MNSRALTLLLYCGLPFNFARAALITGMIRNMTFLPSLMKLHQLSRHTHRANISRLKIQPVSSCDQNNKTDEDRGILQPLVVCGPSGVGKGTIIAKFMEEHGGAKDFEFTVSHTTRNPREGEINGDHYHFTSYKSMNDAIGRGEFLEYAEVHGNLYGTSINSLSDVYGKVPLLDIDVQGVKNLKAQIEEDLSGLQPKFIFISPPSMDILRKRLESRGTETGESLEKRTSNARAEMEYGTAKGNFDAIVVNDDLDQASTDFAAIVKKIYNK